LFWNIITYCEQIIVNAVRHFAAEKSWAFASYVALSTLMAFFPFLIFATSLASFLGATAYAETSVAYIMEMLPQSVTQPIANEITNVLTIRRGGLLTVSIIGAAYFASNGVESLRTALSIAYRVRDKRSILFCRLQSLSFVLAGTIGMLALSLLLVLAPLVLAVAQKELPDLAPYIGTIRLWRYAIAIIILILILLSTHLWLPAGRRRIVDILPGVIFTLLAWIGMSMLFAWYLARFSTYVSTYAGLASIMVAIIYLYLLANIAILGAEINAAIMSSHHTRAIPENRVTLFGRRSKKQE